MMAGFMILGVILSMGKCSFLITGCNMMSREQKRQYDEQALCRFMGKIMYCLAFAMLLWLAPASFSRTPCFCPHPCTFWREALRLRSFTPAPEAD